MTVESVCVIMAKQPYPGKTKTRLYPQLTPLEAADLSKALLLDTIDLVANLEDIDLAVAVTPPEARDYFINITPPGAGILPVEGADIGHCLEAALGYLLDQGYTKALALNADGPTLPAEYIQLAAQYLDDHDIVLGPGHDGGYYLVGMKKLYPAVFSGIQWSTNQVLPQTIGKVLDLGLNVALTPEWYDVDTPLDLQRMKKDLRDIPADKLIHTRRFLSGLQFEL